MVLYLALEDLADSDPAIINIINQKGSCEVLSFLTLAGHKSQMGSNFAGFFVAVDFTKMLKLAFLIKALVFL